jgi:hypothetical protein
MGSRNGGVMGERASIEVMSEITASGGRGADHSIRLRFRRKVRRANESHATRVDELSRERS